MFISKESSVHPLIKYIRHWAKFNRVMRKPDYILINAMILVVIIAMICGLLY